MKTLVITLMFVICMGINPIGAEESDVQDGSTNATTKAESTKTISPNMEQVGEILLVFLVLAVVFEVALTPIFNWRVFLSKFEGKGVKTPITVVLAFLVFWRYDLDIVKDLLIALGYQASLTKGGQFLTALLIAGGSDGIFRIFTKLGIRDPAERKRKADETKVNEIKKDPTASSSNPVTQTKP